MRVGVNSRGAKVLLAAAGAILAVVVVAAAAFVANRPVPPQHRITASHHSAARAPGVPLANQGSAALPSSVPSSLPTPNAAAPTTQAVRAPAAPTAPAVSDSPAAPVPLAACAELGQTAMDAAGNQVQCEGSAGASRWYCDPLYPYPPDFLPVPGQPGPPGGYAHVVLDTDGTAFVADTQITGGWQWQVTDPPC